MCSRDTQFSEERIEAGLCNSTDGLSVALFFAYREQLFDLVIDDGLHSASAQLATLVNFSPKVKVGGTYVIDDLFYGQPYVHRLGSNHWHPLRARFQAHKRYRFAAGSVIHMRSTRERAYQARRR